MDAMPRMLPADARRLLDEHLDAVERALTDSGVSRAQRRTVCDDIDTQAQEMLWQRCASNPSLEDMHAILAELDPPSAYREHAAPNDPPEVAAVQTTHAKVHPLALCALLVPAAMALLAFSPLAPNGEVAMFVFLAITGLFSIILAVIAIREVRSEPQRFSGTTLALSGALAIPLLVLHFAVFMLTDEFARSRFGGVAAKRHQAAALAKQIETLKTLQASDMPMNEVEKAALPQLLARTEAELAAAQLTPQEGLIAWCEPWLSLATLAIAMGLTLGLSVFVFAWLNRRCRTHYNVSPVKLKLAVAR